MGTEIAVRADAAVARPVRLTNEQLQYIARTEFVPPGLRGNLPAILACVATGRELGIGDMVALKSIHIIDGKATFSAELMVQLVRRRGHSITGEVSDGSATITGTRADNGDEMTSTWTIEMAERAGLLNKSNWKKYPEAMLWARAASQLCRMLFADCFAGATYTPEELDGVVDEGEFADLPGSGPVPSDKVELVAGSPVVSGPDSESVGVEEAAGSADRISADPGAPTDALTVTAAQKKKLNLLVGQLRDAGKITNEQLWRSTHREPVASEDGEVHWSPLRDSLSKDEASALVSRLQTYADNLKAAV